MLSSNMKAKLGNSQITDYLIKLLLKENIKETLPGKIQLSSTVFYIYVSKQRVAIKEST